MTNTVTQAVEQRTKTTDLIEKYKADFATVLPSHIRPDTWIRLAKGVLRRNDQLANVATRNSASLLAALLDAARLGLEPGTDQYYLVPFGQEIVGIVGYQGEIELIYRAGAVSSVKAEIVYERDEFEFTPDMQRPRHKPNWFGERGDMIGVYAYAEMKDGSTSRVVVMSKADVEKVKAVSRAAQAKDSPWNTWPDRMWLKTAIHQLAKWVPTSAEYRREQARAEAEAKRPADTPPANVDHETGEIFDGELVDEGEQQ